jgi:hypothetical protein
LVGDLTVRFCRGESVVQHAELLARGFARASAPIEIDHSSARCGEQPRFGIRWASARGPRRQCRGEGFGERILGGGNVACSRREKRDELTITSASDCVGGSAGMLVVLVAVVVHVFGS